jgi:uncharacterized protein
MFVSGIVQGAAGFGFGLVSIALMSLVVDVKEASVMLALSALSINVYIFCRLHRWFRFDRVKTMMVCSLLGVPLGVMFLVRADVLWLLRILGVLLLMSAVQNVFPLFARLRWHPIFAGAPSGALTGALAGAFGTGGPPAVAYIAGQNFDKLRFAATMQAVLGISAILRIGCLGFEGLLTQRVLAISAAGIVFAIAGAWIGLRILHRLPERALKTLVAALLALLGFKYLLAAG